MQPVPAHNPGLHARHSMLCVAPPPPAAPPQGISDAYKHIIRSFLVHFHANIMRHSTKRFDYRGGSVGNFFFAGARIFFRWPRAGGACAQAIIHVASRLEVLALGGVMRHEAPAAARHAPPPPPLPCPPPPCDPCLPAASRRRWPARRRQDTVARPPPPAGRSLEAAIFLFSRVARIPEGSLVLPAICTGGRPRRVLCGFSASRQAGSEHTTLKGGDESA